jgi:hypothetical protein
VRKCTMAPSWPYCRLWHILWGWNQNRTSWISVTMISWSWLLISSQRSTICRKICTSQRRLLPILVWTIRRLMCVKETACLLDYFAFLRCSFRIANISIYMTFRTTQDHNKVAGWDTTLSTVSSTRWEDPAATMCRHSSCFACCELVWKLS